MRPIKYLSASGTSRGIVNQGCHTTRVFAMTTKSKNILNQHTDQAQCKNNPYVLYQTSLNRDKRHPKLQVPRRFSKKSHRNLNQHKHQRLKVPTLTHSRLFLKGKSSIDQ
jgi:hypothetical protein